jgi:hypothetical protein
MLSRSIVINRTPGESSKTAGVRLVDEQAKRDAHLTGKVLGRVILLALLLGVFAAFVLLNGSAVVEPGVRMLLVTYDRPRLLPALLLTSLLSVACSIAAHSVFRASRQRDAARDHSLNGRP